MWLMTTHGFFSVVEKPEDRGKNTLTVRTRNREDIDWLVETYFPKAKPFRVRYSDYEWRIRVPRRRWANAVRLMAMDIDYDNFKDEVTRQQGRKRHDVYSRVWGVLLSLEDRGRRFSFKGKGKGQQAFSLDDEWALSDSLADDLLGGTPHRY
jgi:hypothetical protein